MKGKLNITVDQVLIREINYYAFKQDITVSQLVEQYFKSLVRPSGKKNILELLDELPRPEIKAEKVKNQDYYEQRKHKYGF